MASGSFNVSTNNQYISGHVDWSSSEDTNANTSQVSVTLYLSRNNTGYETSGSGTFYLNINGTQISNSAHFDLTYNSNTAMVSGTVTVPHNDDGSKTITISAWGSMPGTSCSMNTNSASVTLPTIARQSVVTGFPAFYIDGSCTVTIQRASSSYTEVLQLFYGNTEIAVWGDIGDSFTFSLNAEQQNNLYTLIPNSASAPVSIHCITLNGDTQIGTITFKDSTAMVSDAAAPTLDSITCSEANSNIASIVGKYVQNLSKLSVKFNNAWGVDGASIVKYSVTVDGITYDGTSDTVTTNEIKSSGTVTVQGTITDSRGKTKSVSTTISVLPYNAPTINTFTLSRCNSDGSTNDVGQYVKCVSVGSASSLYNSSEKNTLTYTIYYKLRTDTTWTTLKSSTTISDLSLNVTDILGTVDAASAYDFEITITDKFMTTNVYNTLSVGSVALSIARSGIGVGKIWQQGVLDVKGDSYFEGNMYQNGYKLFSGASVGRGSGIIAESMASLGDRTAFTGRDQYSGDCYSYNTNSTNNGTPATYSTVFGFGMPNLGMAEICRQWCDGTGLWVRSIRDVNNDWTDWDRIWTDSYHGLMLGENHFAISSYSDPWPGYSCSMKICDDVGWSGNFIHYTNGSRAIWMDGHTNSPDMTFRPDADNTCYLGDSAHRFIAAFACTFSQGSQRALKENIVATDPQANYDIVKNLKTYNYDLIGSQQPEMGVIIEELSDAAKAALLDKTQTGVNLYSFITALCNSIQILQTKVETLDSEVAALKG